MTKIVSDPDICLQAILNNQSTFLPTESGYIRVYLDSSDSKNSDSPLETFLFSSGKDIYQYCTEPSILTRLLIQTLTPGPIQIVLPSNGSLTSADQFIAYVPDNFQVLDILNKLPKPIQADFNSLDNFQGFNEAVLLKNDFPILQILPTLINCTLQTIQINRPGVISFEELRNILPKKIKLERKPKPSKNSLDLKIQEISTLDFQEDQLTIVLGTKESLQQVFHFHFLDYFHHKQMGNFILFNLGSITSSENIAVNLQKNLLEVAKFGIGRIKIMKQVWPKNKWGEIIQYTLDAIVTPEFIEQGETELSTQPSMVTV